MISQADLHNRFSREPERPKSPRLPPIIHYSAEEPFTKYEICLIFARILGLPHAHITPDAGPPPPGTGDLLVHHILTNTDDLIRVYLISRISCVYVLFFWTQGLHHARSTRSYICVRRKTWASKVDLGRAGLRNGGRITSAITTRRRLALPPGVGKRERGVDENVRLDDTSVDKLVAASRVGNVVARVINLLLYWYGTVQCLRLKRISFQQKSLASLLIRDPDRSQLNSELTKGPHKRKKKVKSFLVQCQIQYN